jgi:hypothetical protein
MVVQGPSRDVSVQAAEEENMAEHDFKEAAAEIDSATDGVSAASRNLHAFASEIAEMSKQSLEHATETLEKLRGARGMSEILAIQTGFVREAFEHIAQHTRKFSELLTALPIEMTKTYQDAWTKSISAAVRTSEEAGRKAVDGVEHFSDEVRKL